MKSGYYEFLDHEDRPRNWLAGIRKALPVQTKPIGGDWDAFVTDELKVSLRRFYVTRASRVVRWSAPCDPTSWEVKSVSVSLVPDVGR